MKEEVKVSVVIPVYNSEKYLCRTLDSICSQTLREIEIICVDDGSEDASMAILEKYACIDDRITVLRQAEQSDGAAKARNLGVSHAHGKYLSVLDSDDFFEPCMLEKAYRKAVNTDADIVIYDGYVYDENIKTSKEAGFILRSEYLPCGGDVFAPEENAERLFQMTLGAAWNCLIKRSLVVEKKIYFQSFHHADDVGFVYLAFACADKIAVLKERLIYYRINNAESQASNISKWHQTSYQAFLQLKKELASRGMYEKYKISFVQAAINYIIFYLENMRDYRAFSSLYEEIHNKYVDELDMFDVPEYKFCNIKWLRFRNILSGMSAAEYLYKKMYRIAPFGMETTWKEKIPAKSQIVIYGAGNVGTDVFCEVLREKKYTIQAWVDRQYEKIGYPVVSTECIRELNFDYVLVAVEAEGLYKAIYTYLKECGVGGEQILWVEK